MPAVNAPQQQQPMDATPATETISQQPTSEPQPQPEMTMRGGFMEECGCCCCSEEVACC